MGGGGGKSLVNNVVRGATNPINALNPTVLGPLGAQLGAAKTMGASGGIFDSLFGKQNSPQIPGVQSPDYAGDQAKIDALGQQIRGLYGEQATAENAAIDKTMQDMITNLTTGEQGNNLRQEYNRLGLLNSGAFNQGLANQFTPIQQQAQQAVLEQGMGKFGDLRNLAGAGVERQFGLEDWMSNAQLSRQLAQMGANVSTNLANQNSQNQLINSLIGGGVTLGAAAK